MSRKVFSLEIVHTASFSGDVKPGTGHSLAIPVASLATTMDEMAEAVRRNRQLKTLTTRHSELTTPLVSVLCGAYTTSRALPT